MNASASSYSRKRPKSPATIPGAGAGSAPTSSANDANGPHENGRGASIRGGSAVARADPVGSAVGIGTSIRTTVSDGSGAAVVVGAAEALPDDVGAGGVSGIPDGSAAATAAGSYVSAITSAAASASEAHEAASIERTV